MKESFSLVSEEVLSALKNNFGSFLTVKELKSSFNLPPAMIAKAIKELKSWGYAVEGEEYKGYRLAQIPDLLFPLEIKDGLKAKVFGRKIHSFRTIGSTNELGFTLAENGAPEGTLIVAEQQTKGKGRLGRFWYSPPNLGIWMSLILRPSIPPAKASGLSLCAGLALALTINELTGLKVQLKWPNDCLVDGKKVGGILLELSAELDRVNFVIAGVGINVNQSEKDFPKNLVKKATSLRIEKKENINRLALLRLFLQKFERIYLDFKKFGLVNYHQEIKDHFFLLGRKIKLKLGEKIIKGKAEDIDENGALIIQTKKGEKKIFCGEVTVI